MKQVFSVLALALLAAGCANDHKAPLEADAGGLPDASVASGEAGTVYLATNDASDNMILAFPRGADGALGTPSSWSTGGAGTGGGLGNQGGVALRNDGRLLYVVNAGSDNITAFRVRANGLDRLGVYSAGDEPISIAVHGDLLYVLEDGSAPGVSGFRINAHGGLSPIPNSGRPLPAGATPDAAQVGFSPDGDRLVVTAKATGELVTWKVRRNGLLGDMSVTPSSGATPFGFAFDRAGFLYVTEAFGGMPDAAAVSSYARQDGGWSPEVSSLPITETATCWIAVTPNGRFAYVTNTGSASVSGLQVGRGGAISLLDSDGVTGNTGMTPIDLSITRNGRYLYTLNAGAHSISAFAIASDGSLEHLGETTGLPAGANGLAAN